MGFDRVELPAIWVPEGASLPAGIWPHAVCFRAILIPDDYDGPRPGYPWVEFGRMTLGKPQAPLQRLPSSQRTGNDSGGVPTSDHLGQHPFPRRSRDLPDTDAATGTGTTAGSGGDPVPVTLDDGSVVQDPRTGGPLLQPAEVSLARNEEIGQLLSRLPHPDREAAMVALFAPGGLMDYQRTYGSDGRINRTFIDFGNFNFGAVAAAAGYTKTEALIAAGAANLLGTGDKSGPYFINPRNLPFIVGGYDAYAAGLVKPHL
ncbi:MAG TPA: hypothetical protein VKI44_18620 [Acetobacteraceae bacterium]|nr:hypothetical protein [Acetobacteraceae bacterium]